MSQPLDLQSLVKEALSAVLKLAPLPEVGVVVRVEVTLDLPGPVDPTVSVTIRGDASLSPDGQVRLVPGPVVVE